MDQSPRTPRHSRHPSKIDLSASSSAFGPSNPASPIRISHSRKSSIGTPSTIGGSYTLRNSLTISSDLAAGDNGFGNLADELADAWDEDEDLTEQSGLREDESGFDESRQEGQIATDGAVSSSPVRPKSQDGTHKSPGTSGRRVSHRRKQSLLENLGEEEDVDEDDTEINAAIEAQINVISRLSKEDPLKNGMLNMINNLKDLGSQAGMEMGTSRLITAHSALSTNIANQTRAIHTLTFPLLSPFAVYPSPDSIEDLIPLLVATASSIPVSTSTALTSLNELSALTTDLIAHLSLLSDNLHMGRQTTTAAARKLKTVTDMVRDQRREHDAKEEGIRWITKGGWDEKLKNRACKSACGDVVIGFEEVCQGWRKRLVEGLGAA